MTQEQKKLVLKDLCARLPYRVKVYGNYRYDNGEKIVDDKKVEVLDLSKLDWFLNGIEIKPYLRPMLSMTEEEYNKYELTFDNVVVYSGHNNNNIHSEHRPTYETFDYLDSIHVDYRDLIPKGLALEAPEGMYNIK